MGTAYKSLSEPGTVVVNAGSQANNMDNLAIVEVSGVFAGAVGFFQGAVDPQGANMSNLPALSLNLGAMEAVPTLADDTIHKWKVDITGMQQVQFYLEDIASGRIEVHIVTMYIPGGNPLGVVLSTPIISAAPLPVGPKAVHAPDGTAIAFPPRNAHESHADYMARIEKWSAKVGVAPPGNALPNEGEVGPTVASGTSVADAGALPAATGTTYSTTGADDVKGVVINAADKVNGRTLSVLNNVPDKILKVYGPKGAVVNGQAADVPFSSGRGQNVTITCLDANANTWMAR